MNKKISNKNLNQDSSDVSNDTSEDILLKKLNELKAENEALKAEDEARKEKNRKAQQKHRENKKVNEERRIQIYVKEDVLNRLNELRKQENKTQGKVIEDLILNATNKQ
ncbi:hypothetical protein BKG96_06680 [Rodentibacter caecimuris]|uniref:Ribbon-helix-helix protein CopG domain-containing protein n=1 Tax=Rodentibacter caecimuris TaxID=1796644 RepID=A0A1V3KLW6_9PAST|nr:ribbon-helix-helix protein, CopG family [Rodentibacter heylii]OOF78173.1 hypothetical protein BKG96_06680 [Rodentibacter heylii]